MNKIKTWEQRDTEAFANPENKYTPIYNITQESRLLEIAELRAELKKYENIQPAAIVAVSPGKVDIGWIGKVDIKHNMFLYTQPLPQIPQNHIWAVSNKTITMLFWSEKAARQTAASVTGSIYLEVNKLNLLDSPVPITD